MTTWNLGPFRHFHPRDGEVVAPHRFSLGRWRQLLRSLARGWWPGYRPEKRYMRGARTED